MDIYMVLKPTGRGTKKGRSAVVLPLGKKGKGNIRVVGNIPELCHGMFISLELDDENNVLDYNLTLSEKNLAALEKAGYDTEEYRAILERHMILKKDGVGWNTARLALDEIYETLPFGEADKVHREMINDATEPTRVEALNRAVIDTARSRRRIEYSIEEYLGYFDAVEQEGAYQHLMASLKVMCLQASRYAVSGCKIWDAEMKSKEEYIRENIRMRKNLEYELLTENEIRMFLQTVLNRGLALEQLNTLECLKNSIPCIITGGAGCGKTTVIQTLIDCYAMHYSRNKVLLIAPTGKASRRLAEKTGMPASTIHKALRKNPEEDYTYYTEENPLPHRLIIVDESSMIDTALMYDLLSAVDPTSKIIFVGDNNQLYPVGYGEPFFDFMQELEVFRLVLNHRQKEGTVILENAQRVLDNKPLFAGAGVDLATVPFSEIGSIVETIDDTTQIITPYNSLNAQINHFLKKGDDAFNVGDKVMTIKNTKDYCNGDIGYVTKFDKKGNIFVDIDGTTVKITAGNHNHLTLAYAITVHKMQGSEADRVIVLIPEDDKLDKRLMYTAITRAKNKLELYRFTTDEE